MDNRWCCPSKSFARYWLIDNYISKCANDNGISKIYEVKITSSEAKDLSISLLSALAKVGIVKGGISIISSTLSASFTTVFISKTIQSITSVWIIKIVGFSLIEYFKNDQSWGDEGIQEIVQKIYRLNKKEETLNIFIKWAISKLKIKKISII